MRDVRLCVWLPILAATLGAAAPPALGGQAQGGSLAPGFGIVVSRNQRELILRIDPDAVNIPTRLQGQRLVCRRLVRTVYAPQSQAPLAEEWRANGAAEVLPALDRSGLPLATLLWEDPQLAVRAGDRVELGRLAPDAAAPAILSLRVLPPRAPQTSDPPRQEPVLAPGEVAWVIADVFTPTGEAPRCEWTADAGEFVHAGGASAGQSLQGPRAVRWRAPAEPGAAAKASIRIRVTAPCRVLTAERAIAVNVQEPKGPYSEAQWIPIRAQATGGGRAGPVLAEPAFLAAGASGELLVVDVAAKRLMRWGSQGPRFVPLGNAPATALAAWGDVAFIVQGDQVLASSPGAAQPQAAGKLPPAKRLVGLRAGDLGDLYALDTGEAPVLHVLPHGAASWQQALLGPKGDAPWLALFALDPLSNDVFVYDSRDRVVRQWRALQGVAYQPVPVAMPVGSAVDRFGPPVGLVMRPDADHAEELPVQLIFKSGAVTDKWNFEPRPPRWEPLVRRPPRELADVRFAVQSAAPLPDGDLLLGGQATTGDGTVPLIVQLSPAGGFRRMLPLPEQPPRFIAAAPNGRRYVLLAQRTQRLVALDPDGWIARDLGVIEAIRSIARVRADRSSPDHVYVIGNKAGRESAFRLNVLNPSAYLELSALGFPGSQIPDHEAVDIAASPHFVAILDRAGKVLLFANEKPPRFITMMDTGLRRPAAIALAAEAHDAEGGRQPFLCVLPSGKDASGVHLWQLRTAGGGKPTAARLGVVPDPQQAPGARLSSPVTLDSAFPDRPGTLYVLDRGGAQVRAFDLPAIAEKLSQHAAPEIPAPPVLDKLPVADGAADMAVGPGQLIHIADTAGEAVRSYGRSQ